MTLGELGQESRKSPKTPVLWPTAQCNASWSQLAAWGGEVVAIGDVHKEPAPVDQPVRTDRSSDTL
jgi:hypothetical protein